MAIDTEEEPLGTLRVRASAGQAQRLVAWAAAWPGRTWAVEGASGLGHLLAQQVVAAGERVPGVQLRLGARVRLLATGASNKNNPNDALPVAVAALRSRTRRQVSADDHATVLKVWSRRHRDLGRAKNQVACRAPCGAAAWSPAACPRRSLQLTPPASSGQPRRPAPPGRPAASSPPSSWRTCAAWMPRSASRRRSWPPRSRPPHHHSGRPRPADGAAADAGHAGQRSRRPLQDC